MECFTELTLRTLESRTPLVRCHRQYLVNPEQVREIRFEEGGAAEMIMPAGDPVPVSRRYLKALKEQLGLRGDYAGGHRRRVCTMANTMTR